nr:RecName: Full=Snaclec uracolectin [Crotalus vegrandis]
DLPSGWSSYEGH